MRPPRLDVARLPRLTGQSLFNPIRSGPCHCFHTAPALRLPNPYSKRPVELPQPADKAPSGPPTHPDHGLYGFFRSKRSVTTPSDLANHGTFLGVTINIRSSMDSRRTTTQVL